jgi:Universal stress protein family
VVGVDARPLSRAAMRWATSWRHQPRRAPRAPGPPTLVIPGEAAEAGALVPDGRRAVPARRVLVGIDGSAPSLRALDMAGDLAEIVGGEVVAVAAVEDTPVLPLGPATSEAAEAR